jgi:hypothetical protein
MTSVVDDRTPAPPLAPVTATMRAMFGTDQLPGLAPGLLVADDTGWLPATRLVDGTHLPHLLDAARHRWQAAPHAAAALTFKAYTYWLTLPVVLGWAAVRRVPLPRPADVLIRAEGHQPLVTIGLRPGTTVAVLPTDPLATDTAALARHPEVRVVADEAALLDALRGSLLDEHLTPLLAALHDQVRIGARPLLGSVAASVAHAVLRAADTLPGSAVEQIGTLLDALGVADLIELVPDRTGAPTVRRRTCCLAFTLPRPKVCGDCCLRTG